jgi:hypothetical protein
VPFKYRNILFTTIRWGSLGACMQRPDFPDPWPVYRQGSPPRLHTYANPNLHTNLS